MQVIPFGNIIEDRLELSKKYDLIKCRGQVWLLTEKCRKHYDPSSYIKYLQGKLEKPAKKEEVREKALQELLKL
jgi:hypothetical protein